MTANSLNFDMFGYDGQSTGTTSIAYDLQKNREEEKMAGRVGKVIKSGEATLIFHDDYCRDKTPEEVQEILDRIAAIALPGLKPSCFRNGDPA